MRKKWLAWVLAVCICLAAAPTAFAAGGAVISVTPPETPPGIGETFTVNAEIKGNPGFSAVQFTLAYDDAVVECVSASTGAALRGALAATNPKASDGAIIAAASVSELTSDGVLASFTFKVIGSGSPDFSLEDSLLSDATGNAVAFTVEGVRTAETKPTETKPEETKPAETKPAETKPEEAEPAEPLPETPEPVEHKFRDTADHWAENWINTAVDKGFFQGYSDGTFRPGNQVTRGAFVTVLWRMAGRPQPTAQAPFTDTANLSAEFQSAIAWAWEKGYVGGRTATTFAPGDPVTRQAAMKILFLYSGGQSGQETLFTQIYDDTFTDSAAMVSWAKAPMYWAIYNELISGTTATTLGAGSVANRAQLAKILVNYTEKFGA